MIMHYDIPRLNSLLRNIGELSGIAISFSDPERRSLARYDNGEDFCTLLQKLSAEKAFCPQCDRRILDLCRQSGKLEHHICWTGLYDAAMPIRKNGQLAGYILMGRVRSTDSPEFPDLKLAGLEAQRDILYPLYQKLPVLTEKQLSALYNLLPSVLFDHAVSVVYDPLVNQVVEYIDAHLQEKLTIKSLCGQFYVSVNGLYAAFESNLNCTVGEYIIEQRLQKARQLLTATQEPVYTIAEKVGIDNYAYFCRLFKKRTGLTPTEYRKNGSKT